LCSHANVRSTTQRARPILGSLFAVSALIAAAFVATAGGTDYTSVTVYSNYESVPAGTSKFTAGWNYRTENSTCRSGASGWESTQYINSNNQYVDDTTPIWTNCSTGPTASLTNNGYYKCSAGNNGTITHTMYSYCWNYSP
jgi:hypothetical protein